MLPEANLNSRGKGGNIDQLPKSISDGEMGESFEMEIGNFHKAHDNTNRNAGIDSEKLPAQDPCLDTEAPERRNDAGSSSEQIWDNAGNVSTAQEVRAEDIMDTGSIASVNIETEVDVTVSPETDSANQGRRKPAKLYKCTHCNKEFAKKGKLVLHERTHTGEKPFACDKCDKRFAVKCHLTRHHQTHNIQKPFACDMCDKKFAVKDYLTTHHQTHNIQKPFACDKCDKKFAVKCHLTRHHQTHNIQKPFACDKCDKKFAVKDI